MDPALIPDLWPVEPPCRVEPLGGGINNSISRVISPTGTFVLRLCRQTATPESLRYEQEVIGQLSARPLPFALPVPLAGRRGELLVPVDGPGGSALATLVPVIPGIQPDRQNLAHARAMGEAVGALTRALAGVRAEPRPASVKTYADLGDIHPAVPDPVGALEQLPLEPARKERMAASLAALIARAPSVYATVPLQQIHGDIVTMNMLAAEDRITGVLDFEFTCYDLRTLDLVSGLCGWVKDPATAPWPFLDAFGQGYCLHQELTEPEIACLPPVFMLRRAAVYANMAGLFLTGKLPSESVLYGVDSYLWTEEWLDAYGAELQRRARLWGR